MVWRSDLAAVGWPQRRVSGGSRRATGYVDGALVVVRRASALVVSGLRPCGCGTAIAVRAWQFSKGTPSGSMARWSCPTGVCSHGLMDGTLRLWDSHSGASLAVLEGHTVRSEAHWSWSDGRLLSWSDDETLRLWDGQSGASLTVLEGHTDKVKGTLILADGRLLSWSDDKTLRLWDEPERCESRGS